MASLGFEKLVVYRLSEELADAIWEICGQWNSLAKATVGRQLIRAADSIGANIAEGAGRGTYADNKRFVHIARGSLYEVQHFLRRAYRRSLLKSDHVKQLGTLINNLRPALNGYLKSIGRPPRQ